MKNLKQNRGCRWRPGLGAPTRTRHWARPPKRGKSNGNEQGVLSDYPSRVAYHSRWPFGGAR